MSHVCCITHTINLVEQVCICFVFGCTCLTHWKAFLAPFKALKHQKWNANCASAADDVVLEYAYESGDADTVEKVNELLEDLHVDNNDNNEMARRTLILRWLRKSLPRWKRWTVRWQLELGGMMKREHQDAMFMLSRVCKFSICMAWVAWLTFLEATGLAKCV